ncbi:hypothetical protein ACFQJ5_13835 [Halomicroarcula sp. GCM10025324]|uniref:hypothetical protein n=1 Tax=Haloarcula TaxID=2237 RepID=UPI0023E78E08|nr:hypothetical protein [Halomicroarcula sp. ZS-22-S1]
MTLTDSRAVYRNALSNYSNLVSTGVTDTEGEFSRKVVQSDSVIVFSELFGLLG